MLEKAFAKFYGNYSHIEAGSPPEAVSILNGGPYEIVIHSKSTQEAIWARLVESERGHHMMIANTPGTSDSEKNADGLVQSHAYSVMGTHTLSDGVRLVKLRNPWGRDSFHGRWSDQSELWT